MSTKVRPNSDAVSDESAASVHRRPPASTVNSAGVGTNAEAVPNRGGNTRSGGANKSSAPVDASEADSAEAAMAMVIGRFVARGPPSGPVHGMQYPNPGPGASPGPSTHPTTPKKSTTEQNRIPTQKNGNTTSMRPKK